MTFFSTRHSCDPNETAHFWELSSQQRTCKLTWLTQTQGGHREKYNMWLSLESVNSLFMCFAYVSVVMYIGDYRHN